MIVRSLLALAVLFFAPSGEAQTKNVYFYGAIVRASSTHDPGMARAPDYVLAMSTRSREDARRIACAHFDPNVGNAARSSPAHLQACLSAGEASFNNPNDGSTWTASALPLECRQARHFALAMGTADGTPPGEPFFKFYMTCGKKSITEARDLVMDACRKEYPRCHLYVAAFGDGSFGGVMGVGVPNRPQCWGRDAVFDETVPPEGIKSILRSCREMAESVKTTTSK